MYDAFAVNVTILGQTGAMAGSDDEGTAWAASYDARAREILDAVNDLTLAMENYGGVVIQAGHNHAIAEHNATPGSGGPPPERPPDPQSVAGVLTAPPSAGGPGEGLIDNALGLVDQIGVPVPDGDTDKIDKAAQAWDRLATVYQTKTVPEALDVQAGIFSDTSTPEVEYIAKDLGELRDAANAILSACGELSQSCTEYRSTLDDLRDQLSGILEDLAVELAATAVIGIAASFVTFGAGAVAATAKTAHTITKFAKTIRTAIAAWKTSKNISKGVKKAADVAGIRQRLQRIKNLGRKRKPEDNKPPPQKPDPSFEYNIRPERLDHTFAPKHKLDGVVERAGSREEAMGQMLDALKGNVPQNGTFETVVSVSGEQVTVRGFVDNGIIKIGTAFIP
ncbi:hypothetical protein [Mycobacterium sp. IS-3022]|uniref:WXG100-like domain-containing protein n=1 Tax=Mycobacterium sp. IS-3022 TaxID=1772277 RepID=UPI001C12A5AD|nr:hypothetical protein [Mycobacterium sp. IS-3022]